MLTIIWNFTEQVLNAKFVWAYKVGSMIMEAHVYSYHNPLQEIASL